MLKGIDVSHHNNDQGSIDWNQVRESGYDFAMVKLTEGQTFIDPSHVENVHHAKEQGLLAGGYHFARFQNVNEAEKEAAFFKGIAKKLGLDYVILDLEHPEARGDLTFEASAFMDSISGVAKSLLYSYPNWIRHHLSEEINQYPLWIAHYGVKQPDIHPWEEWQVWQHSSSGKVTGIAGTVDENFMKPEFAVRKREQLVSSKKVKTGASYTIQKGDTFWELEERWGLLHGTLVALNPHLNPRKLQVGQMIHIPRSTMEDYKIYEIQPGDTLSEIAEENDTTVKALMAVNPNIYNDDLIFAGEKIRIPKS